MSRRIVAVAGVAAALGLLAGWAGFGARAAPALGPPAGEREFAGKTLVVLLRYDPQQAQVTALEQARITRVGDVPFLTGTVVATSTDVSWKKGARLWVPVHEVTQIAEYPSLDDAQKAVTIK